MKTVSLFLLLLLTTFSFRAQDYSKGIVVGLDITNVFADDNVLTYSSIVGFNINARFGHTISYRSGFFIEPGLMGKGYLDTRNVINTTIKSYYLQLPILFEFIPRDKLSFFVGPELGYLLKANARNLYISHELTDQYDRVEVAGILGIKYQATEKFDISFRVNQGIVPIQKIPLTNEIGIPIGERKLYNRYLQLSLGNTF